MPRRSRRRCGGGGGGAGGDGGGSARSARAAGRRRHWSATASGPSVREAEAGGGVGEDAQQELTRRNGCRTRTQTDPGGLLESREPFESVPGPRASVISSSNRQSRLETPRASPLTLPRGPRTASTWDQGGRGQSSDFGGPRCPVPVKRGITFGSQISPRLGLCHGLLHVFNNHHCGNVERTGRCFPPLFFFFWTRIGRS